MNVEISAQPLKDAETWLSTGTVSWTVAFVVVLVAVVLALTMMQPTRAESVFIILAGLGTFGLAWAYFNQQTIAQMFGGSYDRGSYSEGQAAYPPTISANGGSVGNIGGMIRVDNDVIRGLETGLVRPLNAHDIGAGLANTARFVEAEPLIRISDPNVPVRLPEADILDPFENGDRILQPGTDYPNAAFDEPIDNLLFGVPDGNESLQPFNAAPSDANRRRAPAIATPHWSTRNWRQGMPEFDNVTVAEANVVPNVVVAGGRGPMAPGGLAMGLPGAQSSSWAADSPVVASLWNESPAQQQDRANWNNTPYGSVDRLPDQDARAPTVNEFYKKRSNDSLNKFIFNRYGTEDPYNNGAKTGYGAEQRKRILQTSLFGLRDPNFIRNSPAVKDGAFHLDVGHPPDNYSKN